MSLRPCVHCHLGGRPQKARLPASKSTVRRLIVSSWSVSYLIVGPLNLAQVNGQGLGLWLGVIDVAHSMRGQIGLTALAVRHLGIAGRSAFSSVAHEGHTHHRARQRLGRIAAPRPAATPVAALLSDSPSGAASCTRIREADSRKFSSRHFSWSSQGSVSVPCTLM